MQSLGDFEIGISPVPEQGTGSSKDLDLTKWKMGKGDVAFNSGKKINTMVAIPAYNEEIAIGSIVMRSKKYADMVVVVDDCSSDHTAETAMLAGAEVISHKKNGGYGVAIRTCFNAARAYNADRMIILDGDGQHNPDDIPALLETMNRTGADIVIGSRFARRNGTCKKMPKYRIMGMKILDKATLFGSGLKISDSQSGFRVYSKRAIYTINPEVDSMGAGSEILIRAAEKKLKVSEVPIYIRYDIDNKSSKNPIVHGASVLKSILWLDLLKRPMLFFAMPGLLLISLGVILYAIVFDAFNVTRNISTGYATAGMLCAILGAISLFIAFSLVSFDSMGKNARVRYEKLIR